MKHLAAIVRQHDYTAEPALQGGDLRKKQRGVLRLVQREMGDIVQRNSIIQYQEMYNIESLDPVLIENVILLSIEQYLFPRLIHKGMLRQLVKDVAEQDKDFYARCGHLQTDEENLLKTCSLTYEDIARFNLLRMSITELRSLNFCKTPREALNVITDVVQMIGLECHNGQMTADEILPLFLYVIVKAELENAVFWTQYIELFANEEILQDVFQYNYMTYCSAIEFIQIQDV